MNIEITQATFEMLQSHATPLVDSVEDVIIKLLNSYEVKGKQKYQKMTKAQATAPLGDLLIKPKKTLKGFKLHLLGVLKDKIESNVFTLNDVYSHCSILQAAYPNNKNIDSAIRAGLQELRDLEYVRFLDGNGMYELLEV